MKNKKHKEISKDFKAVKHKHLEQLATKMLKNDEKAMKKKTINKSSQQHINQKTKMFDFHKIFTV